MTLVTGTPTLGSLIEIEGTIRGESLEANLVHVKTEEEIGKVWLVGSLDDLNTGASSFTLRDGNVTVEWNDDTRFDETFWPQGEQSLPNGRSAIDYGPFENENFIANCIQTENES